MKKYSIILSAVFGLFALASCQKVSEIVAPGENDKPASVPFELVANIDEPVATKTTLDVSSWAVDWEDGDIIYAVTTDAEWGVAYKDDNDAETVAEFTYDSTNKKFTTTSTISDGEHTFNFLYSNGTQKSYHRGASTTHSLYTNQTFDASNPTENIKAYDALAAQLTATTPASLAGVSMSHLYTLMKVTLKNKTGNDITATKFEISADSGTYLYGIHTVTFGTTPSVTYKQSGGNILAVNIANGAITAGQTLDVYFVMAPLSNYSGNITFKVTDSDDNTYSKTNTVSSLTLAAGNYNTANFTLKAADTFAIYDTEKAEYSTGFEDDFTAGTTYNNTSVALNGPENGQWGSYYGTVSTNNFLSGTQSMQMRWYTSATSNLGYAETNFIFTKVGYISFKAAATNGLKVGLYYKSTSDDSWTLAETFTPTTSSAEYRYSFSTVVENAQIRFGIILPSTNPSGTSNVRIDDVVVTASIPTYTVTISDDITNGTVTASPSSAVGGTLITLTITPDDDYILDRLTVVDESGKAVTVSDENTFTMPYSNVTVGATFYKDEVYNITVNSMENGTVTPSSTTARRGDEITLTVSPDEGYALENLSVVDESSNTVSVTDNKFTMPASSVTISATFKSTASIKTYSFTISASDFNSSSYDANNSEKTSIATATDGSGATLEVKWTSYQVMLQSEAMQWQKSKGCIYNSTDLGSIVSVVVTSTAGTFTTYYGTEEKPSSNTTVGNGYFQTKVGSATGKTSGITVTFTK